MPLEPFQIKNYHVYGVSTFPRLGLLYVAAQFSQPFNSIHNLQGEKVFFEKEEMKVLKTFGDPGLVLMGFKPKSSLKPFYYCKTP